MKKYQVLRILRSLGNTPDEVADSLRQQNMKGWPGASCNCPIASYLKYCHGVQVRVGPTNIIAQERKGKRIEWTIAAEEIPPAISEFIFAFDHTDKYADLDRFPMKKDPKT